MPLLQVSDGQPVEARGKLLAELRQGALAEQANAAGAQERERDAGDPQGDAPNQGSDEERAVASQDCIVEEAQHVIRGQDQGDLEQVDDQGCVQPGLMPSCQFQQPPDGGKGVGWMPFYRT